MVLRGLGNTQTGIPGAYMNMPLTALAPRQAILRGLADAPVASGEVPQPSVLPSMQDLTALANDAAAFVKAHPIATSLLFFIAFK